MSAGAFVLNIKPGHVDMVDEARAHGRLLIGWGDADGLLNRNLSYDDVRAIIQEVFHSGATSLRSAGAETGSVWRFLRKMKAGDLVVIPHDNVYYVARVLGEPTYGPIGSSKQFFYQRPARWFNSDAPLPRNKAPSYLRGAMSRRATCSDIASLREDVEAILRANDYSSGAADRSELVDDIADVIRRYKGKPTQRDALVAARLGQGEFRENLLSLWGHACAVTGCTVLQAVRASHLKPWRSSSDKERLDPDNGLPLLASLDALFDAGLIAFDESGRVLTSSLIRSAQRRLLGLPCRLRRRPVISQQDYLRFHRENHFIP